MPQKIKSYRPAWMPQSKKEADKLYNKTRRDPKSKAFYVSRDWRRLLILPQTRCA